MKTFDGPGRGRKQCPDCKAYVPVRTGTCDCGYIFQAKEKQQDIPAVEEVEESEAEPARPSLEVTNPRFRSIAIPAGKCPVKLHGTDPESIEIWAHGIIGHGHDNSVRYEVSALCYWVRDFYDIGTPEHKAVCGALQEMFSE